MEDNRGPEPGTVLRAGRTEAKQDESTDWSYAQTHDKKGIRQSNDIRRILEAALEVSLASCPFEDQLRTILGSVLSVGWLTLEQRGAVLLADGRDRVLVMSAQHQLPDCLLSMCSKVPYGRCLCGRAAATRSLVFADCINDLHDNRYEGMSPHGHYCVPIIYARELLGVLNLYVPPGHVRRQRDEEFLRAVAAVLAGIIKHRQIEQALVSARDRLARMLDGTIQAMATSLEVRDPYTAGHQRQVAAIACAIATEMGLAPEQIDAVRMAGLLHDIGKLAVPADILNRPGRLSEAQLGLIKEHSQVGYEILKSIEFPWPIADIVLQHHERMDGSGYPGGLSGDQVMVEARILAVADVVQAMASHRPYRPAHSLESALAEIASHSGTSYDARVVEACVRAFQSGACRVD